MLQIVHQAGSGARRRIVDAAIRLYREIGYKKTTVADIARGASMSPTNVYRFFPSRRAIEEAVVVDLFEEVTAAAARAARGEGSPLQCLEAAFRAISELHEERRTRDSKLNELMAAAVRENWSVTVSHADRIRGLIRPVIAAGQARGELRQGSPITLATCLLEAMNAYLSPSRAIANAAGPTFNEMIDFCAGALLAPATGETMDSRPDLPLAAVG